MTKKEVVQKVVDREWSVTLAVKKSGIDREELVALVRYARLGREP